MISPKSIAEARLEQNMEGKEVRADFDQFLTANVQCNSNLRQGMSSIPPILRSNIVIRNLENSFKETEQGSGKVKITLDDIEEEVLFWKPSMVCYVLGVNPPLHVLEGFAKRVWQDKVDRMKLLSHGIFIIRFHSAEYRDQVINGGYVFFNRRPVIMKPWDPNVNFKKEDVKCVPIWVQLEDLELKYWGQKSLFKIVGQLGKPLMEDSITRERERLNYPRVLVEVIMDQKLPDMLEFENEYGMNTSVGVKYEWKPISCSHCSGIGHSAAECKRSAPAKQQWIVKKDNRKTTDIDEDGLIRVSKGKKVDKPEQTKEVPAVKTTNPFQALSMENQMGNRGEFGISLPQADWGIMDDTRGGGGGEPSLSNG
ncbi:uncharacterized protein LOC133034296 [Cannabis sativa]|uniref:uncharacterized protein LOC133034296 n=1 Tax=Cannabis sativa TaxID=3483 RepID=UPI0029CA93EC|nr:uncharacterized protein LOC133034296 [Cannabis sativa]